ncbi:hypothetical protein, partial [Glycomyces rutgersensis]
MTTPDELQRRIDSLRGTTADIRTIAGLLLLAPGGALAGAGILGSLHGTAHILGSWALITAVSIAAPIGTAIAPRRPATRRQSRAEIITAAEQRAAGASEAIEQQAAEIEQLQDIVDA